MKMKLNSLTIRNFKGIKEYELAADGQSLNIYGDNATGKTTLYDAFLWCLFGKNSEDQATFDWKPLDEVGNEINHLETEVATDIEIDGKTHTLSRTASEKWTKKRGSVVEMFDGHTTVYKIDDISVKKKEYEEFLADLIDEDLFKLLTNVSYFPEKMKWQDRRQTLIDMVGDVSDADIIAKNKDLEPLKGFLEDRPADELKQLTQQQMRQINKDIKALPDRIDEVDRGLPDISKFDKDKLLKEKTELESQIENLQEDIAEVKNSNAVVKLKNQIAELRIHYRELEVDYKDGLDKELEDISNKKEDIENEIRETKAMLEKITFESETVERSILGKEREIQDLEKDREMLLEKFYAIRAAEKEGFEVHQTTCPTCGQDLPEEELLKTRLAYEKEVEVFNSNKALDLKENKEQGGAIAEKIKELQEEAENLKNGLRTDSDIIEQTERHINELNDELAAIDSEIAKIRDGQNPFKDTEKAKEVTDKANDLQKQIDSGQSNVDSEVEEINQDINGTKEKLSVVDGQINDIKHYEKQAQRKEELIQEEQTLSVKYGELEQRLHLLEEFTRTKVNLLTDTINSRFKLVKFKLFDEQINGGLAETCEVTVNGNNYSTGLNNAMRINAGLDIINTLMGYYDTYTPVFIDNAESVNELIDINTQLITLSVSNHKNLRVVAAS